MRGGYSPRSTLETRPRIPAAALPPHPGRTAELNEHHHREGRENMWKKKNKNKTMTAYVTMVSIDSGRIQEMSGTACSEMWGLWFSSDLLSDRLSPCNLKTTQRCVGTQTDTHTHIHFGFTNWCVFGSWRRDKGRTRWASRRHRGSVYRVCFLRLEPRLCQEEKHEGPFLVKELHLLLALSQWQVIRGVLLLVELD